MKATAFEFRFRVWIIALLYVLGFVLPWPGPTRAGGNHVWAWLAEQFFRMRVLPLQEAFEAIAIVACLLALIGAGLRVWATAYLGSAIVRDAKMHADALVIAGPYRFLRNPLYLGTFLTAAAVSILMPPLGALFFLVALALFELRLIAAKRAFLAEQLGDSYLEVSPEESCFSCFLVGAAALGAQPLGGDVSDRGGIVFRDLLLELRCTSAHALRVDLCRSNDGRSGLAAQAGVISRVCSFRSDVYSIEQRCAAQSFV